MGKTDLCLEIAESRGIPVINADSRQIYRDMPIGTAAPTAEQMRRVKHYFVGTLALDEYYNASMYEQDVMTLLSQMFEGKDNALAMMTGGSMMYIDAVCNGIDDIPTISPEVRQATLQLYQAEGLDGLLARLQAADPEYYAIVDRQNTKRVIHAIEIITQSGVTYTSLRRGAAKQRPFRIVKVALNLPRPQLFERINARVLQMIDMGLEQEARSVYHLRHLNSLNTVGYKEMFAYFDGIMDRDTAIARIQKKSTSLLKTA